jgi:hypothetical protein
MDNGELGNVDMEPKGNDALNIYEYAFLIAYLQANEIPVKLTPKDLDHIRPINSSVNAIPSYKCE